MERDLPPIFLHRQIVVQPENYKGVRPVCAHGRANDREFCPALRNDGTQELLGFTIGHLDAPATTVSLNDLARSGLNIGVKEYRVAVTSPWITTQHDRTGFLTYAMIPKGRQLMDHQFDLFSIALGTDFRPCETRVFEHVCRGRESVLLLTRSASSWNGQWLNRGEQCRIGSKSSGNMYPFGTSFEDRITTVATVSDDPEAFALSWSQE